jgi:hypothetical protein
MHIVPLTLPYIRLANLSVKFSVEVNVQKNCVLFELKKIKESISPAYPIFLPRLPFLSGAFGLPERVRQQGVSSAQALGAGRQGGPGAGGEAGVDLTDVRFRRKVVAQIFGRNCAQK